MVLQRVGKYDLILRTQIVLSCTEKSWISYAEALLSFSWKYSNTRLNYVHRNSIFYVRIVTNHRLTHYFDAGRRCHDLKLTICYLCRPFFTLFQALGVVWLSCRYYRRGLQMRWSKLSHHFQTQISITG